MPPVVYVEQPIAVNIPQQPQNDSLVHDLEGHVRERNDVTHDVANENIQEPMDISPENDRQTAERLAFDLNRPITNRTRSQKRARCPSPMESKRQRLEAIELAVYFYALP